MSSVMHRPARSRPIYRTGAAAPAVIAGLSILLALVVMLAPAFASR